MGCSTCGHNSSPCRCNEGTLDFPTGPSGPTGPPGATGPQGLQGLTGLPGTDGLLGPTTVTKFVKDLYAPGSSTQTNVSILAVTSAELTGAGMLRAVYNANTNTANQVASGMDFTYQIWFRDVDPVNPSNILLVSATEGTSPKVTAVNINSLNGISLIFANGGGSYRIIICG